MDVRYRAWGNLGEELSQLIHTQLREHISAAKEDRGRIFGLASHPVSRRSKSWVWNRNPVHCYVGLPFVGPKRLPTILGQIARAKAQLENANRNLESELEVELELQRPDEHVAATKTAGEQ